MDINKILLELRQEYERLSMAIAAMEQLQQDENAGTGMPRRRGRPKGSKNKAAPSE